MAYEIIDEKLGIKSCNITDLTAEQVGAFLASWDKDSTIGSLTLFSNEKHWIVLNKDNPQYTNYLDLAQVYLAMSDEQRADYRKIVESRGVIEAVAVLDRTIERHKAAFALKLINHTPIDEKFFMSPLAKGIVEKYSNYSRDNAVYFAMNAAFVYGKMRGKHEERARRKKTA